jgi:hypothetical protein
MYNGSMDISNFFKDPVAIATLVLAFVTAALAIGTFLIIRQNSKFREKDRKERLLNEIIDWAIETSKCDVALNPTALVNATDFEKKRLVVLGMTDISRTKLKENWGKSTYIKKVILSQWSDLNNAVGLLIQSIGVLVDLESECIKYAQSNLINDYGNAANRVSNQKEIIYKYVEKVIEEATKIKIENLR